MKVNVEEKRKEAINQIKSAGFAEEIIENFKQNIIMIYDRDKHELRKLTEEENAAVKEIEAENYDIAIFFAIRRKTAFPLLP